MSTQCTYLTWRLIAANIHTETTGIRVVYRNSIRHSIHCDLWQDILQSSKIMFSLFCVMCVLHSEHHVLHTVVKTVRFTDN